MDIKAWNGMISKSNEIGWIWIPLCPSKQSGIATINQDKDAILRVRIVIKLIEVAKPTKIVLY